MENKKITRINLWVDEELHTLIKNKPDCVLKGRNLYSSVDSAGLKK